MEEIKQEPKKRGRPPKIHVVPQEGVQEEKDIVSDEVSTQKTSVPEIRTVEKESTSQDLQSLAKTVERLEKELEKSDEKIKMLEEVADKGRVMSYQTRHAEKKPMKVKLSVFNGRFIVGWRVLRDELVMNPTTGRTVGEIQEYELLLLDKEKTQSTQTIQGYPAFSDARYGERTEVEVVGKKEDWAGNLTFVVRLPDGETYEILSRFVN